MKALVINDGHLPNYHSAPDFLLELLYAKALSTYSLIFPTIPHTSSFITDRTLNPFSELARVINVGLDLCFVLILVYLACLLGILKSFSQKNGFSLLQILGLLFLTPALWHHCFLIRVDLPAAVFGYLGLLLFAYSCSLKNRMRLVIGSLLAGILIGLGCLSKVLAVVFLPIAALLLILKKDQLNLPRIESKRALLFFLLPMLLVYGVILAAYLRIDAGTRNLTIFTLGFLTLLILASGEAVQSKLNLLNVSRISQILSYLCLGWIASPIFVYALLRLPTFSYPHEPAKAYTILLAKFLISPPVTRYMSSTEEYLNVLPSVLCFYLPVWIAAGIFLLYLSLTKKANAYKLIQQNWRFFSLTCLVVGMIFFFAWRRFSLTYAIFTDGLILLSVYLLYMDTCRIESALTSGKKSKFVYLYFLAAFFALISAPLYKEFKEPSYFWAGMDQNRYNRLKVINRGFSQHQKKLLDERFPSGKVFDQQLRAYLELEGRTIDP